MYRIIAGKDPVGYEQNIAAAQNWNGVAPDPTHINNNGVMHQGVFEVPADPGNDGGLFDFGHQYPVVVSEGFLDIGTNGSWTLTRVRGGSGDEDTMASGGSGKTTLTRVTDKLPILSPGDKLKLVSTGITALTSKATFFVQYIDGQIK